MAAMFLVAAGAGFAIRSIPLGAGSALEKAPEKPVRRTAVSARGRIQPVSEVIEIAAPPNDRIESIAVVEGDEVEKDALLARVESWGERLRDRDRIASVLSEARTRLAAETGLGAARAAEARNRVDRAEKLAPHDIASQEALVRIAEATLDFARGQQKRQTDLIDGKTGTIEEGERRKLAVRQAEEDLARARTALERLRSSTALERDLAREQLATVLASTERARAEITVDSTLRELALAEERLRLTELRAPCPGRILKVIAHPGESTGARAILRMADMRQMVVIAEIYETDARFVALGARARVTSPALPAELTGTVDRIGRVVARNAVMDIDPAADADARVVETRVRLESPDVASRFVNLQVTVHVPVDER
jgi:HlyD family secretion protein